VLADIYRIQSEILLVALVINTASFIQIAVLFVVVVVVVVVSRIILFWDLLIYYFPRNFKIVFN
jgi:hypothetical protein